MTSSQINFYTSLTGQEQFVLKMLALNARSIDISDLQGLVRVKYSMVQKIIKEVLEKSAKVGLVTLVSTYSRPSFSIHPDFLIYICPQLTDMELLWKQIIKKDPETYFYFDREKKYLPSLRNLLYTLCHNPKQYTEYEANFLKYFPNEMADCYANLLQNKSYTPFLHLINPEIVQSLLGSICDYNLSNLVPSIQTISQIERLSTSCKIDVEKIILSIRKSQAFYQGNFSEIINNETPENYSVIEKQAIIELMTGNAEEALKIFKKVLTLQSKNGYKSPMAFSSVYAPFYYLVALFCIDNQVSMPVFQKIYNWIQKHELNFGYEVFFSSVIFFALNQKKPYYSAKIEEIQKEILSGEPTLFTLIQILIIYLAGEKMDKKHASQLVAIAQKGYESKIWILTYEVLYALKSWFNDAEIDNLYQSLSEKLNYPPVLSKIVRQEDWEKSLNLLLGLKSASTKSAGKAAENTSRVVYYFNPKNENIQPVLQTRQAKGWSSGRNIALKTFFNGDAKGMTDQDFRIAKTLHFYNNYYDSYYEFKKDVFPALVGHPYIFLDGTDDTPVEFVEAKPIISIKKELKKYRLTSDIKIFTEKIIVEKETNTRYRIYELTPRQQQILQIINEQFITVPEHGKEKLVALLGTFSAEGMNVYSDLVATENTQVAIREVSADERIRVQLLPFGDGLKAELYVKPFGDRPPYCKAGKGGKALISNEKDVQLQVKRNFENEKSNETVLLDEIQGLESLNISDDLMSFDEPLDSLYLLDILRNHTDICVTEWPEGERFKLRGTANFSNLKVNVKSGINWFNLDGELKVDEKTVVSLQKLLTLTAKGHNQFIELDDGEFLALSKELKKHLDELRLFTTTEKDQLRLNKFASVALGDFFDDVDLKADKQWKDFRKNIENTRLLDTPVPANLQAELRNYQEDGFRWLARLSAWEGGACLADDMGLGKTVQTLAILLHRAPLGAALVVCPVSVVGNWINEIQRFAPTLTIKTLGAGTKSRKETLNSLEAGDVLLVSYGLLQSEEKLMAEPEFATVVLDEAHVIKNYATKTSKATMQLKAHFRIALTGTPIQNHLGELWNLFNFINPGLLGSLPHFNETFVKESNEKSNKYLKKLISPFILRRTKTAVLDELPPKTEIVKKITLSADEMAFYEALRRQALENLSSSDSHSGAKHLQVLAEITKLRQASCNPLLVNSTIDISSSKMAVFLDIVGELRENKHRALVFSQFVTHLALVRKELDKQGIKYQYLDGSTPQPQREESVRKFQNGEGELFLISLKAGGLGLNLTAADFVIHLDPWWNPAVEDQASDRAHRIGQQRPVTIYRLVAENTIEEKIIQLHATKRDLADTLLEGSDMSAKLSLNELVDLIKNV
ncbi:SWF/SNF family helicase [Bacteroidia bacterium]|nr:SWF/SNF family helicase [Bacteroidia bacterium]